MTGDCGEMADIDPRGSRGAEDHVAFPASVGEEGEKVIEGAKTEVRRMEEELDALDRSRRTYLAQMRTLIARQLSEVEASDGAVSSSRGSGSGSGSSSGGGGGGASSNSPGQREG